MAKRLRLLAFKAEVRDWSLEHTDEGDVSLYVPLPSSEGGLTITPEPDAPGRYGTMRQDHAGLIVAVRSNLTEREVLRKLERLAS